MNVRAPGKIIFSGEHAVVYGHPALAMAVDRYVDVSIRPQSLLAVTFESPLGVLEIGLSELASIRDSVRYNHQQFVAGVLNVKQILNDPAQLALFALSLIFEEYDCLSFDKGFHIHIQSTIPMGCGMGSSAALILSILVATAHYLKCDISNEQLYRLGLEAENMQHGKSSGVDLHTIINGGCIYRQGSTITPYAIKPFTMYLVNTGTPASTTGECLSSTEKHFKTSSIGNDFAAVTQALTNMLTTDYAIADFKEVIRQNHQLLNTIGAVPQKVAQFIRNIETHGGAAKICGAGAVKGDCAGMVLVVTDEEAHLKKIASENSYTLLSVQCESRGVCVI